MIFKLSTLFKHKLLSPKIVKIKITKKAKMIVLNSMLNLINQKQVKIFNLHPSLNPIKSKKLIPKIKNLFYHSHLIF